MVHNLMVHEAMPGHYLQLQHSRRFTGSDTAIRAALRSGAFTEGWAVYTERIMAEQQYPGEGDPRAVRMQQLKMQLRTIINAILDARIHGHGMTETEAMALMTGRGYQEEGEAAGKWRRAQLTSAQLSTYYVGYCEISDLAADRVIGQTGTAGPLRREPPTAGTAVGAESGPAFRQHPGLIRPSAPGAGPGLPRAAGPAGGLSPARRRLTARSTSARPGTSPAW
jgi:Bacterial protein of unknown function (DUF885)